MSAPASIRTPRLELIPLSLAWHQAALAGERARCARLLADQGPSAPFGAAGDEVRATSHRGPDRVDLCPEWSIPAAVLRLRSEQLRADPGLGEWLLRAIVRRPTEGPEARGLALGHVGFHSRPAPDYLAEWCPEGVELGYFVSPAHRRRGYAREAALGLMDWATRVHGVRRFVASVAPDNLPSQAMVAQLGFARVGAHQDEEHGVEEVFVRSV